MPTSKETRKIITERLGYDPRNGCEECPKLDWCKENGSRVTDLPCMLSNEEAGIRRTPRAPQLAPEGYFPEHHVHLPKRNERIIR